MILKGALCNQDFMAKEIQKSGDFSSRTIMEEILLQHREKHHSSNNPKSKEKKKTVQFLQWQSEAAILV